MNNEEVIQEIDKLPRNLERILTVFTSILVLLLSIFLILLIFVRELIFDDFDIFIFFMLVLYVFFLLFFLFIIYFVYKTRKEDFLKGAGFLVPLIQYLPNATIWFGIMSIPLIMYFSYAPFSIYQVFYFLGPREWTLVIIGFAIFLYSLIVLLKNRKDLVTTGPYKYIRHPQYFGIILMTLGFTYSCFHTSPIKFLLLDIFFPEINRIDPILWLVSIWIIEVVLYIILALIEEVSLLAKYGEYYVKYKNSVPFMIPYMKIQKEITVPNDLRYEISQGKTQEKARSKTKTD